MPYCNGGSLADLLRRQGALPEKDAKSVVVQVLHGLRHLHAQVPAPAAPAPDRRLDLRPTPAPASHRDLRRSPQRDPVIHYDLKPANILFHDGEDVQQRAAHLFGFHCECAGVHQAKGVPASMMIVESVSESARRRRE